MCGDIVNLADRALADRHTEILLVRDCKDCGGLNGAIVIVRSARELPAPGCCSGTPALRLALICHPSPDACQMLDSLPGEFDDFLCCPFHELEFTARLRRSLRKQSAPPLRLDHLIGESPVFLKAVERIGVVARSTATVLIEGETGVGKELFARAVHYNGPRADRPFVPINCSALPDELFENELFGHVRGAFTGAIGSEGGLLGEARGGSLFLDEVDMLSPSSQAKLLRFLQGHEYRPLGSAKALFSDARIIAASNADLRALVLARQFREDLYHRLNVLPLSIPPLRERPGDIPLLATHFAVRYVSQYGKAPMAFSREALSKLMAYPWPGNVRELECMVHRAVVFSSSSLVLEESAFDMQVAPGPSPNSAGSKDEAMRAFERRYLMNLLAEHRGNLSHSAAVSGKDRRTLQRLLRKHGIERLMFRESKE